MSTSLDTIVSRAKRKGFVYPNSEIYGGLANMRDYGPYGSLLKKNIVDLRTKYFVQERSDVVYMDTTILAHPTTRVASGHVGGFSDALIDDKNTGQRFRADKIIEAYIQNMLDESENIESMILEYMKRSNIELGKNNEHIDANIGALEYVFNNTFHERKMLEICKSIAEDADDIIMKQKRIVEYSNTLEKMYNEYQISKEN
jgi:glycyl-tRNA synthetase (class II)